VLRGVFRQILLDVLSLLEFLFSVVLFNRLKSNLEISSKLKRSIEELFKHEVWLIGVHVYVHVRVQVTTTAKGFVSTAIL
jgi:hypothetical protein